MEIRLLEYFAAVCETLNFTKAAEKLNISQPNLSQQIKILEHELGTRLFQRTGKKVYITKSGEVLLEHARQVFSILHEAKVKIRNMETSNYGRLTIGCTGNFMHHAAISAFREQYPQIEISLLDLSTSDIIRNIESGKFDLGLVFLPIHEPRLACRLLLRTKYVLVVSSSHPLAEAASVKVEDLPSISLNYTPRSFHTRQILDDFCRQHGISLKIDMELTDASTLLQMAILNKGAAFFPEFFIRDYHDDRIRKLPIEGPFPLYEIGVIHRQDAAQSPLLKTFVDFVAAYYEAHEAQAAMS